MTDKELLNHVVTWTNKCQWISVASCCTKASVWLYVRSFTYSETWRNFTRLYINEMHSGTAQKYEGAWKNIPPYYICFHVSMILFSQNMSLKGI
jgi:hypothetical protein